MCDDVFCNLLYVIRGTLLEILYRDGRYRCLEQNEYADLVCAFIERLPKTMIIQRLTGDPHPKELVAPLWSADKRGTLDLIHKMFTEKQTWQGKRFQPGSRMAPTVS